MKKILSIFMIIVTLMTVMSFATIPVEPRTSEKPMLINETEDTLETESNVGDNFVIDNKNSEIKNEIINGNEFIIVSKKCIIEDTIINGNLFILTSEIEIKNTTVTGSAFILAKNLTIENSNISDLYTLVSEMELKENTVINRGAKILGQDIAINSIINGNTYIHGSKVEIQEKAMLNGKNEVNYTVKYIQSDNAKIKNIVTNFIKQNTEEVREKNVKSKLLECVEVLVKTAIIVGIIFIFGFKKFETFIINDKNRKSMLIMSLIGFLNLILIPIIAIMIIFLSFGLLFGIGFLLLAIYVILIYITKAVVAFSLALLVRKKYMKKDAKFELFGITLIITALLWVATEFPVIGGLVNFIILVLGLGITVEYIFKFKKIKNEEEIIMEPEIK